VPKGLVASCAQSVSKMCPFEGLLRPSETEE